MTETLPYADLPGRLGFSYEGGCAWARIVFPKRTWRQIALGYWVGAIVCGIGGIIAVLFALTESSVSKSLEEIINGASLIVMSMAITAFVMLWLRRRQMIEITANRVTIGEVSKLGLEFCRRWDQRNVVDFRNTTWLSDGDGKWVARLAMTGTSQRDVQLKECDSREEQDWVSKTLGRALAESALPQAAENACPVPMELSKQSAMRHFNRVMIALTVGSLGCAIVMYLRGGSWLILTINSAIYAWLAPWKLERNMWD